MVCCVSELILLIKQGFRANVPGVSKAASVNRASKDGAGTKGCSFAGRKLVYEKISLKFESLFSTCRPRNFSRMSRKIL